MSTKVNRKSAPKKRQYNFNNDPERHTIVFVTDRHTDRQTETDNIIMTTILH